MKHINELTEQEILNLTNEEVLTMIKLRKAEEGIKFIEEPKIPEYFAIESPDMVIYTCGLFNNNLVFTSASDMEEVISLIKSKDNKFKADYNYNVLDSSYTFISPKLDSYDKWDKIESKSVYSQDLYKAIEEKARQNKKMKEDYEKALKEYRNAVDESKWIEEEINGKVRTIQSKYYHLNLNCYRFKNEYLPLADNNEEVAMNFMDKAYNLTEEQKEYILANYKDQK